MFPLFERTVALRYLRARRQEGFISLTAIISLVGIALGVATLIVVMSVMNGFRAELFDRVLGLNGHIAVMAPDRRPLGDFERLTGQVRGVEGVVSAHPSVEGQTMLVREGRTSGALARGIRADDLRGLALIADNLRAGSLAEFGEPSGVVLGDRLAARLGLRPGDSLSMLAPKTNAGPFGAIPRTKTFRLLATFHVGMYEYDNSYAYMPLETAQRFFKLGEGVSNIEVKIADPERVREVGLRILTATDPGVQVFDWRQSNASFVSALEVERNVMFLILTLIIMVAAFNVLSSMIMLVKDKARDIAILRAIGATRGAVMRIFFLTGSSIGVLGTAAGFALGLAFAMNIERLRRWIEGFTGADLFQAEIYFLSRLPAKVDSVEVAAVVAMSLLLSVLAPLYPCWRAARQDPADALRYE